MNKTIIKDNFYQAVNDEWLEKAVIPGDQPAVSAFLELHLDIEKTLMELTSKWEKDQTGLSKNLIKFIKIYNKATNFESRQSLGSAPIKALINQIEDINLLSELENNFKAIDFAGIATPFGYSVMQDFLNSQNQVLYFSLTRLILPDTSYYKADEQREQLLSLWKHTTSQILKLYGLSDDVINKLMADTIAFDSLLVPITKSSVEQADYVKMYNPLTVNEIHDKVKNIDLVKIANSFINEKLEKLVVIDLNAINKFDTIFNEDNFEIIKSWMILNTYLKYTNEFNEELRVAGGAFMRSLSGAKEAQAPLKAAFNKAYGYFGQEVGLYYGLNYFGPKAKMDVETMVFEMIEVYKSRIKDNSWLAKNTKAQAIKKLETLTVLVGYPEELPKYYDLIEIDDNDNLLDIRIKVAKLSSIDNFNEYNKAPNKKLWGMPASMVNAYYSPLNNQIVFPAAILQKPYYSLDQSPSANFGGIGAVIAHEISHAFDNNGAKFDEFGSLKDWWTSDDVKAFELKQAEMVALFDGLDTGYGKCNGLLTVSENIADSGGLRAALEASKAHKDHNYEDFFINWANVWRQKAHKEYSELLLTVDVHGPAILRVNMQLANLEEFQDFYKLTKDDKMYLAKDKMVSIW